MDNFTQKIWEILKMIALSLAIVLPIRYFIAQPFIVSGASMEPSFYNGEYLIVDELSYRFKAPSRGEVIVFHPPNQSQFYIKRVIGLPNEKIEIKNGEIIIYNDQFKTGYKLKEKYLPPNLKTYPDFKTILDEDEYFVLGDNRTFSFDSRGWGSLPAENIVGRAFIRLWPINKIDLLFKDQTALVY